MTANSLPKYLKDLGASWEKNHCTTVSGLMAVPDGGPIDDCVRDGAWDPELQLAHGGPRPFLSCSRGSRGVVESWPYVPKVKAKKWGNAIAHGIYKPAAAEGTEQLFTSMKKEVGTAIQSAT